MALGYHVSCEACGAEWPDVAAGRSDPGPAEVTAVSTCPECFKVTLVTVKLTAKEVAKYRRDVQKTVQKMYQGYLKARSRLEEKQRVLALEVREGKTDSIESLSGLEKRLAALRPPDTAYLDARAKELVATERDAPREAQRVLCPDCGAPMTVHRETHRGFEVPCPRCRTTLKMELRGG